MGFRKRLRFITNRTELYIFLVFVAMCVAIQIVSGGKLFELNSLVDIARSMTIFGMFALVSLLVIISGGFDLSFPTLASLVLFSLCGDMCESRLV